jgi:hypothetical protein
MSVKYYIDSDNKYIGGFDGTEPPVGSSEVSSPPGDASMEWDGSANSWFYPLAQCSDRKLIELKEYYKSDEVRTVTFNNHFVKLSSGSLSGTDGKRTRLKDNVEITEATWYFDDGSIELLDLEGFTSLNKLLWDTDQNLRDIRYAHEEAINALTTVAEIKAYDFKADINGLSWV